MVGCRNVDRDMNLGHQPLMLLLLTGCVPLDVGVTKFNNEPEVKILSHQDGEEVFEGYPITLRGSVSDPNDSADNLVATWYSGSAELCATAPVTADGDSSCAQPGRQRDRAGGQRR